VKAEGMANFDMYQHQFRRDEYDTASTIRCSRPLSHDSGNGMPAFVDTIYIEGPTELATSSQRYDPLCTARPIHRKLHTAKTEVQMSHPGGHKTDYAYTTMCRRHYAQCVIKAHRELQRRIVIPSPAHPRAHSRHLL
jgi:hypothetical protein